MNINRMLMLATAVASLTANAQVKLNDKNASRLYRKAASQAMKIRVPRLIFVAFTRLTIPAFSSSSMAMSVPSTASV